MSGISCKEKEKWISNSESFLKNTYPDESLDKFDLF